MTTIMTLNDTNPRTQADEAWKDALDCWFRPFLFCFWPDIAKQVDWEAPISELSQELSTITGVTSLVGKHVVDKLYRLHFSSKQPILLLLHVEVQGSKEENFAERMLQYGCKLYLHYNLPVLSLVVLSDNHRYWHPEHCALEAIPGKGLRYSFCSVKLLNWKGRETILLESRNPFDNLIAVHLKSQQNESNPKARLQDKQDLFDHFVEKGWDQADITNFYLFLDRVMRLPRELELHYHDYIKIQERKKQMTYVTSAEQIGIEKGIHEGIQQGLRAGIDQNRRENAKKMLQQGASYTFIEAVTGLSTTEIDTLQ